MTDSPPRSFESAYARLEEILQQMNSGKVSLEDSLKLYEEADQMLTWCHQQLSSAEKKIEFLVKNREGEILSTQDFQPSASL